MSEELETKEVVNEPITTETVEVPKSDGLATALADSFFNGTLVKQEVVEQPKTEVVDPPKDEDEIFDEVDYLKDFGWENKEKGKEEIKQLREKAANADKGFEFKNEDSKKIAEYINEGKVDDLYSFLDTQRKIDKLSKAELTDKNVAAELVKFGIQKDNPNLTSDDIEFLFNEKYSLPEKPIQGDLEDDTEYAHKIKSWEQQVSNIERKMIIEAKIAQPKLAQLKSELVQPNIKKESDTQQQPQVSQEDLAKIEAVKTAFLQSAPQTVNSFDGFKVQVKDKDVDYTVAYAPSAEEKSFVDERLKMFAQNLDANALFYDRWMNEDGSINQSQLVKDYMRVITGDKAEQKLVTDAVGKRMEAYITSKKRPNINAQQQQGTFTPVIPKSEPEAVTEAWLNMR